MAWETRRCLRVTLSRMIESVVVVYPSLPGARKISIHLSGGTDGAWTALALTIAPTSPSAMALAFPNVSIPPQVYTWPSSTSSGRVEYSLWGSLRLCYSEQILTEHATTPH